MSKKIKKIIIFLVLSLMVFSVNVYATDCKSMEDSSTDFSTLGKERIADLKTVQPDGTVQTLQETIVQEVAPVVRILTNAGILIIGIAMVVLGIQWLFAKPSPEAQAKLKHQFVALAISAAVLFGSYTIWKIVVIIMETIGG